MSAAEIPPPDRASPALRTIAMPSDVNAFGDIFGGWLMAQMDLAGSLVAFRIARGRVATVHVNALNFHRPVQVGDEVSCYASLVRRGTTSVTVRVDTYVRHPFHEATTKVTDATLVYVALDEAGNKRPLPAPDVAPDTPPES